MNKDVIFLASALSFIFFMFLVPVDFYLDSTKNSIEVFTYTCIFTGLAFCIYFLIKNRKTIDTAFISGHPLWFTVECLALFASAFPSALFVRRKFIDTPTFEMIVKDGWPYVTIFGFKILGLHVLLQLIGFYREFFSSQ